MSGGRPTLAVCVLARSTRAGLERLLDEVDGLADEIVIGVDAASTDDTWALATRRADVAFRFEHVGPPVRARLLILDHAQADWILSLDEDEGLDAATASLLPDLLAQSQYTHYWFTRRWLVERQPLRYLHGSPWYPDWQLRLFRRDPSRVWHPGLVHSGYRVMGAGCREDRAALLHYEPLVLGADERRAKIAYYRQHGSQGRSDSAYAGFDGVERRLVPGGPAPAAARRGGSRKQHVVTEVQAVPPAPDRPPWRAAIDVQMPADATPGAPLLVTVLAKNTGALAWESTGVWPQLRLSCHLRRATGEVVLWDGPRFPLPRIVETGASARLLIEMPAPSDPGDYRIEWDFVSEGEAWFGDCGSPTATAPLRVR